MSERKINLQSILAEKLGNENLSINEVIIEAMKEACRQTLELAAENATTKDICDDCGSENLDVLDGYVHCKDCDWMGNVPNKIVNKQSILDTIDQVE